MFLISSLQRTHWTWKIWYLHPGQHMSSLLVYTSQQPAQTTMKQSKNPENYSSMFSICLWELVLYKYTSCALLVIHYKILLFTRLCYTIYMTSPNLHTTSVYWTNELMYSNQLAQSYLSLSNQYYFLLKKSTNNSLPLQRVLIPTPLGPQIS